MAIKTQSTASILPEKQALLDKILGIAQEEQLRGNKSITKENLAALERHVLERKRLAGGSKSKNKPSLPVPEAPKPLVCPLFEKYNLPNQSTTPNHRRIRRQVNLGSKFTLKKLEFIFVQVLEMVANLLDNLHLFLKLPGFPEGLVKVLLHTNKLWVLILVFLIRKTVLQLLNVIRKEKKVNVELNILSQSKNSKVLLNSESQDPSNIYRKYEKVLKDLRFDKSMLVLELIGNFMDLAFNVIELYGVPVPDWLMSGLNFASMAMTVYRMNKDDEYIDDYITEDLI